VREFLRVRLTFRCPFVSVVLKTGRCSDNTCTKIKDLAIKRTTRTRLFEHVRHRPVFDRPSSDRKCRSPTTFFFFDRSELGSEDVCERRDHLSSTERVMKLRYTRIVSIEPCKRFLQIDAFETISYSRRTEITDADVRQHVRARNPADNKNKRSSAKRSYKYECTGNPVEKPKTISVVVVVGGSRLVAITRNVIIKRATVVDNLQYSAFRRESWK